MAFRPEPPVPDLQKLKSILLTSGLQKDNQPLYQVIWSLIDFVARGQSLLEGQITSISGGGGGGSSSITQIIQQLLLDGDGEGGDSDVIPGPKGDDGANGMVPYFISSSEKFLVPEFKQALFSMNIDNEGVLEVEGFLIEVD